MFSFLLAFFLWETFVSLSDAQGSNYTTFEIDDNQWNSTITRNVCIIGGGSSGTNAAVHLKDLNQTVVIIESRDYLGGHLYTYIDPDTDRPVDIGVVVFNNRSAVTDYFGRFNVGLENIKNAMTNTPGQPANLSVPSLLYQTIPENVDFRSGRSVTGISQSDSEVADALKRLAGILTQYPYILTSFDLPDPVPEDLIMPFGQFVEKYNVTAVTRVYFAYCQGMGDLLNIPTVYVIKYFNLHDLISLNDGYLVSAKGDGSELYERAGEYIGTENIFLNASVLTTKRFNTKSGRAEILVTTAKYGLQLLSCDKILLTIPPTISNLAGWDLTPHEQSVFGQFTRFNGYWTGLMKNVGLNESIGYTNAAENKPYSLPVLPGLYAIGATGNLPDVWTTKFGSPTPLSDDQVKAMIIAETQTLQQAYGVNVTTPEFVVFHSHLPFILQVTPEAMRDGFYRNLSSLQGQNKMFYTGAAFHAQHSSLLWEFNRDIVVPKIMSG